MISAIAVILVIIGLLLVFTGDKKNNTPTSVPGSIPVDSSNTSFETRLDSLQNEFNNFRSSMEERLDSLTAPAWFRKLDADIKEGGVK